VVFVGSSLTVSHISPAILAQCRSPWDGGWSAFNFGLSDMVPPETFFTVRRILSAEPEALRCLVIEAMPLRLQVSPRAMGMSKTAYWHDAGAMRDVMLALSRTDEPLADRMRLAWRHALLWVRNALNCGRGVAWLSGSGETERSSHEALGPAEDGFVSYTARVQRLARGQADENCVLTEADLRGFERLTRAIRRAGIEPVYVVMPRLEDQRGLLGLRGCDGGVSVLDYSDPNRWPEFYAATNHADELHLNAAGAERLTRVLAADLETVLHDRFRGADAASDKPPIR
jgi:hypothetical protein